MGVTVAFRVSENLDKRINTMTAQIQELSGPHVSKSSVLQYLVEDAVARFELKTALERGQLVIEYRRREEALRRIG